MQNVFLWSSVTYECTHVTPSSALVPTTDRQASAPLSFIGISSPSGNERSTMKRAIRTSLVFEVATRLDHPCAKLGFGLRGHIGEKAQRVLIPSAHFQALAGPMGAIRTIDPAYRRKRGSLSLPLMKMGDGEAILYGSDECSESKAMAQLLSDLGVEFSFRLVNRD